MLKRLSFPRRRESTGCYVRKALAEKQGSWIPAYAGMTGLFRPPLRLRGICRQQTCHPFVQVKEEGDALSVRLVRHLSSSVTN